MVEHALDAGYPWLLSRCSMRSKGRCAYSKHRELVLDQLKRRPSDKGIIQAPRPAAALSRRARTCHDAGRKGRHDQLTNAALARLALCI
jgi:hypothetical protein